MSRKRDLIGRKVDEFLPPHRLATLEEDWAQYIAGGPIREEWETLQIGRHDLRSPRPPRGRTSSRACTSRSCATSPTGSGSRSELLNAQKLESLGRLAGGVAHDFNNLLTGITGYASLLLERATDDVELRRDLGEIKRAADRAAELTKQLLAFGRRQVLNPRPLDLNTVVAEVGAPPAAPARRPRRARHPPRARARHRSRRPRPDRAGDRQSRGQRPRCDARRRHADDPRPATPSDGFVELSVTDTGIGMDEQTPRPDLRAVLHDARAGRRPRPRVGLRHRPPERRRRHRRERAGYRLDLHRPAAPCARARRSLPRPRPSPQRQPGSETILLVEDEDVVRDLTRRVLERQGYTVLACADGMQGGRARRAATTAGSTCC